MKESNFRLFCLNKWNDHGDEIMAWTGKPTTYNSQYYFNKHRWLLKQMYKDNE